jgi:exonuclease VII small subunit
VSDKDGKEELYRRLDQVRRVLNQPLDQLTRGRLTALARNIEQQLASAEARDANASE